ncbi:MAG TPA: YIP1 family protein [Chloroflexota bacterium]
MLTDRMIRAARLESSLYEEVERDTDATSQALLVVVIVSVAAGLAAALAQLALGRPGAAVLGLVGGVVQTLLGWAIWSGLTYVIGANLFGGRATYGELLRTLGFAYAPGVLLILSFIPVLGALIGLVVFIWVVIAGVIAVRQALDFDTGRAILTVVVAFIGYIILAAILAIIGLSPAFLG